MKLLEKASTKTRLKMKTKLKIKRKNRIFFLLVLFFILGFLIAAFFYYKPSIIFPKTQVTSENAEFVPIVDRNYYDIVSKEIQNSQQSIDIAMFEFKFYENENNKVRHLLEDLIDAHERGVKIRVLLDESDWSPSIGKDNKKTIDYLIENGIQAKLDNPKKTLHVKLLIIDDSIIIGSTNLGFHALERNNEASILITNSEITEYYKTYFETLW